MGSNLVIPFIGGKQLKMKRNYEESGALVKRLLKFSQILFRNGLIMMSVFYILFLTVSLLSFPFPFSYANGFRPNSQGITCSGGMELELFVL